LEKWDDESGTCVCKNGLKFNKNTRKCGKFLLIFNLNIFYSDVKLISECPENEEYKCGYPDCEPTCKRRMFCAKPTCDYACLCKPGYVRDQKQCILKQNCLRDPGFDIGIVDPIAD
jgi:hypothetical protein